MKTIDPFRDIAPAEVRRRLSSKKLGRFNELKVIYALETLKPWWYEECCESDDNEDHCGVDLWIRHKVIGWVRFQVKSSVRGLIGHFKQSISHEKEGCGIIPCVVSKPESTLEEIVGQLDYGFRFERTHGLLSKKRRAFKKLKR
ncbi:MAG: hypothetical protein WCQ00_03885 [bacterium]